MMGAMTDQVKGRAQAVVARLTGDKELGSKANAHGLAGDAKERLGHAEKTVEDLIDKAKGALHRR